MKTPIKYTQFSGAVDQAPPGRKVAIVIAHCFKGGTISLDMRWFKTMKEAKVEMEKIANSVKAQAAINGGSYTLQEALE